jgi:glycosyltransferase involved in cell wall biosynthesis
MTTRTLALVVPEYRTPEARGGGLAAVADFVADTFDGPTVPATDRWHVRVVSPRMFHGAPEHASVLRPASLVRGPVARRRPDTVRETWDVGTRSPELEANRYRPRRVLTDLVNECDAAIVIAGTPAIGIAMRDVEVPWVLKVATLVEEERAGRLVDARGLRGALLRRATAATARLDRAALRLPDAVVTLNDSMAARLRELTDRPVHLLPTGVDTELFRPAAQWASDGPVTMVSRLNDPRKDVPTLLRAFATARTSYGLRHPLVLAGRHTLPAAHRQLVTELGLEDHVRFVESPSGAELADLLRAASVFVLASREEGLGVVFLEAMASGLPIVTTATRGASYAVPADAGEVVPFGPDLVDDLAAAMTASVHHPTVARARGRAGRHHVESTFSLSQAGRSWRTLLATVVAEHTR